MPGSFACARLELIIVYDVGRCGEAWPKLIIACDIMGVAHYRQTDRWTDGRTSQPGYILHLSPLQVATQKISHIVIGKIETARFIFLRQSVERLEVG